MPSCGLIIPSTTRFVTFAASSPRVSWIPLRMASSAGADPTSNPRSPRIQNKDTVPSSDDRQQVRNRRNRGSWRGKGRPGGRRAEALNQETVQDSPIANVIPPKPKKPQPPRPTHFLALPLHNHASLTTQMTAFHNALSTQVTSPNLSSPKQLLLLHRHQFRHYQLHLRINPRIAVHHLKYRR
ncbi:hypothetical protein CPB84DRAFT_1462808 [Gymnopilus junonius]|uniref:Uncharacterized protein n=1 Tax=Gymnopilus junonius TaxID=109634 RepID=A0A9P5TJL9_GYMJU|nr:hypothetical protein CPB84DRAFT_1462808 [Gymnopilus junonius]